MICPKCENDLIPLIDGNYLCFNCNSRWIIKNVQSIQNVPFINELLDKNIGLI